MTWGERIFPTAITGVLADDPLAVGLAANWARGCTDVSQPVLFCLPDDSLGVAALDGLLDQSWAVSLRWGSPIRSSGPIVAIGPTTEQLRVVAGDPHTAALCVVPADLDDVAAWAVTVGAQRLGSATTSLPQCSGQLPDDPILLKAMEFMSRQVLHTTSLTSGPDRDTATGMLTLLRDSGHWAEPDDLFGWALVSGWSLKSARRLRAIAMVIASGGQVEPTEGSVGHEMLTTWRTRAPHPAPPTPTAD